MPLQTDQTVTETLSRVTAEIKKEESEKYLSELAAHRKTQEELVLEQVEKQSVQSRLYWHCRRKANICAWTVSSVVGLLLIAIWLWASSGNWSDCNELGSWLYSYHRQCCPDRCHVRESHCWRNSGNEICMAGYKQWLIVALPHLVLEERVGIDRA